MKTLYLHIGTPKTGTTTIQKFCTENQEILADKGYYYPIFKYSFPRVGKYCNGHFLIVRLWDENFNRQYEKEKAITEGITAELLELFKKYDNIILSEERIWHAGIYQDINCWQYLKENIMSKGITVKVIVYLRRQDEFLFSWWNQRIKVGKRLFCTMNWQEICKERPFIQLDYYSLLEQIAAYVGKENIIIRIFDKKAFLKHSSNGSILDDFLNILHLEHTDEYQITDSTRNPGLSKNNTEIKRLLNTLPELDDDDNIFFRNAMLQLVTDNNVDSNLSMFSKEETEQFLGEYKDGNAKVAREYLGLDDLFEYSYHAEEQWHWNNDELPADIIKFFGSTTLTLLQEIRQLQEQQTRLEKCIQKQEEHITNLRYKLKHPAKAIAQKLSTKTKS